MTNGLNMLTDKIYCHSNNFHAAPFHGATAPRGGIDQIRYTLQADLLVTFFHEETRPLGNVFVGVSIVEQRHKRMVYIC